METKTRTRENKYNLTPETARVGVQIGKVTSGLLQTWNEGFELSDRFEPFLPFVVVECCNTPDVIYLICTPTLAISGVKLFYFLGFGSLSPCVVVIVMHLISCHHVHCICIRVHLMHSSIFPVVCFAFRHFVLLRWSFLALFRVWGLNISGLDQDLPSGLGLLPVDRLSSFVPFGLRLILQRLTEGPKRPRVCCSQAPLQFGPKPT